MNMNAMQLVGSQGKTGSTLVACIGAKTHQTTVAVSVKSAQ
jgi:hypothetical protein